jgi:hypothetical protein
MKMLATYSPNEKSSTIFDKSSSSFQSESDNLAESRKRISKLLDDAIAPVHPP